MNGIRLGRLIAAGLLSGVVINVGEFTLNGVALADRWLTARQALGLGEETGAAIALYTVWGFLIGLVAATVYASIRPRFGPGVRCALIAGLLVWSLSSLAMAVVFLAAGLYPASLALTVTLGELILLPLATVVGASIYREEPARAGEPAPAMAASPR
jgi:hypothetical protein